MGYYWKDLKYMIFSVCVCVCVCVCGYLGSTMGYYWKDLKYMIFSVCVCMCVCVHGISCSGTGTDILFILGILQP